MFVEFIIHWHRSHHDGNHTQLTAREQSPLFPLRRLSFFFESTPSHPATSMRELGSCQLYEARLPARPPNELPSSIPKAEFVHNAAAFIPFSFGKSLSLEVGKRFLINQPCRSSQLRREAVGNSRYDLPGSHT